MHANQRLPGGPRPKAEDSLLRTSVLVLARLHSFGHAISPLSAERLDYEPGSGGYCRILAAVVSKCNDTHRRDIVMRHSQSGKLPIGSYYDHYYCKNFS